MTVRFCAICGSAFHEFGAMSSVGLSSLNLPCDADLPSRAYRCEGHQGREASTSLPTCSNVL